MAYNRKEDLRGSKKTKSQRVTKFKDAPSKKKKNSVPKKVKETPEVTQQMIPSIVKEEGKFDEEAPIVFNLATRIKKKINFPRIYRFITEEKVLLGVLSGVFLLSTFFLIITMQSKLSQRNVLTEKRMAIQKQIDQWREITNKYPGYTDAYFKLALLEYQLGDFQSSQEYVNTVESLDPNDDKAYQLEKLLER